MDILPPNPIAPPKATGSLGVGQVATGALIAPVRRLRAMESGEWEEFVAEWVDSLRQGGTYAEVFKCGGAGDYGRDVIGFKGPISSSPAWDNYQCKHYSRPLNVADVAGELGKLIYYLSEKAFSSPDSYSFVSPQGPSTPLLKCLEGNELKKELLERWEAVCKHEITSTKEIALTQEIMDAIDAFDFGVVSVLSPLHVIEGHRSTSYHVQRFGGGLPIRQIPSGAPNTVQPEEHVYIVKLLSAYGDEESATFPDIDALTAGSPQLANHLQRSREHFFSAESLRAFSRDTVPEGTFEALQEEIFDGVQETYSDAHASGYRRVLETVKAARSLQITGNPLTGVMYTNDRAGACHQLANDGRFDWVPKEKAE
jgi:hypothetical protein